MGLRDLVYTVYEKRLRQLLVGVPSPRHVGVILDGNRRWAKSVGASDVYGQGADRIDDLLAWCTDAKVEVVTLWLLSTDNLARSDEELAPLFRVIERTVEGLAAPDKPWRVHPVGSLDLLPEATQHILKAADESTVHKLGLLVNVAIGYGGRREITDAVRSMLLEAAGNGASLEELAEALDVEHIADHLYTKGQPDPDLVIRTSGEQRLSGFLLWQSAHSEFYFCEAFWPEFRHVDFLRALRAYGERHRRYGS
ncbi:MAG: short-chain Z-isoprenyl diphosphate synthase [Frankiales bacterium]|jgi:short-chain Z-isoprenyl diphosphate synthase|nr:short-chain Z-isoprenyl diphosphate synthase [Frankiales bacterium]MDX6209579.1 short-chain Z-isoprenyl diphosphate synthase [Frankiales bacterium]MDX6213347.1 short-chain Z-isoprenyl diphosphate synthase [Frankiales bacterium]